MSWQLKFGMLLLGFAAIVGGFSYVVQIGERLNEAKHVKANAVAETHVMQTAMEVAGDFAKLGSDLVAKVQSVRTETQTVVQTQVKYVHDHPLPADCVIAEPIVQLRNNQIRNIYEAADRKLPGNSDGARPAAASGDKPKSG